MKHLSLPDNWVHRHYPTVTSTMLCCEPSALEPGEFLLVTADEQTAGRGQRGTTWESRRGENLTFNIGWKAPLPLSASDERSDLPDQWLWPAANEQFLISEVTALAVLKTIEDMLAGNAATAQWEIAVKWPNDIYVVRSSTSTDSDSRNFKICGMLLEHQLSGRRISESIAGIGINVNQASFSTEAGKAEGRGAPISLRQMLGHEVEREKVLEHFAKHFMKGIGMLLQGQYEEVEHDFMSHLFRRTGIHPYRDSEGDFMGELVEIARNGTLALRKQDGSLHKYAFKEVTYVIDN